MSLWLVVINSVIAYKFHFIRVFFKLESCFCCIGSCLVQFVKSRRTYFNLFQCFALFALLMFCMYICIWFDLMINFSCSLVINVSNNYLHIQLVLSPHKNKQFAAGKNIFFFCLLFCSKSHLFALCLIFISRCMIQRI